MRISDWSSDVCSSDLRHSCLSVARRPAEATAESLDRHFYTPPERGRYPFMSASLPSISLMTEAATISPLALFMQADIVVKVVMLGLLLASIWTWAIILSFALRSEERRVGKEWVSPCRSR